MMRHFCRLGSIGATCVSSAHSTNIPQQFVLPQDFVEEYRGKEEFGFDGLGEVTFLRSYSRDIGGGKKEHLVDTIKRVVEGCFSMQMRHNFFNLQKKWDEEAQLIRAMRMFDKMFRFKLLPSGRVMYAMGTSLTEDKQLYMALHSCAFASTAELNQDPSKPFRFMMDVSMLGIGCGFDTRGAGKIEVLGTQLGAPAQVHVVEDSREGWVESIGLLLDSYFKNMPHIEFDYSQIRARGVPLRGYGGTAAGPETLESLHEDFRALLDEYKKCTVSSTLIVDLMNTIGVCISAGNLRRTAQIAFGDSVDTQFLDLKDYDKNPHRASCGWASNNTALCEVGMDYHDIAQRIVKNGEPGVAWPRNMQIYSRMRPQEEDWKDWRATGGNPCLEQTLESYETCCLVETFPHNHTSLEEYLETLEDAFLLGKTITLGETHWTETNAIQSRNRRVGTSMSGVAQFVAGRSLDELSMWCNVGYHHLTDYDTKISAGFGIPTSIKRTSIKPSGTISLLAGATPGCHFPEALFYIRRMRFSKDGDSKMISSLQEAGFRTEPDVVNPKVVVVEFPVEIKETIKTNGEVCMWEKLELAATLQREWADNQVSCTVTFSEEEAPYVRNALEVYQDKLKGISFLPSLEGSATVYAQMPYEKISQKEFEEMVSRINMEEIDFYSGGEDAIMPKGCTGDKCEV